jgi:hypothetical protein
MGGEHTVNDLMINELAHARLDDLRRSGARRRLAATQRARRGAGAHGGTSQAPVRFRTTRTDHHLS